MRRQDGFTLVELLVAASLMLVVMGAALTAVEHFQRTSEKNQTQNDSQEIARVALEKVGRDLRNAGAPASGSGGGIARATAGDLVFQAADPSGASSNLRGSMWVRYCLDDSVPANEKIYRQTLAINGTPVAGGPFAATCPDPGVGTSAVVADKLVNNNSTPTTALFSYYPSPSASPTQAQRDSISRVTLDALVNSNALKLSKPARLTTGIYLRDQAQAPTAAFDVPLVSGAGVVFLNASASTDATGLPMTYLWCDTTSNPCSSDSTDLIGRGLTLKYAAPSGTRQITLVVTNGSGLSSSTTQAVVVP